MPEPQARKSTVSAHEPEDWPHLFEQRLNAGDVDVVMALYESEARFVARSGETLAGHDWIREVLGRMIAEKTRLHSGSPSWIAWLKKDCDLGHGHSMSIWAFLI
jgi:hypothetical protein